MGYLFDRHYRYRDLAQGSGLGSPENRVPADVQSVPCRVAQAIQRHIRAADQRVAIHTVQIDVKIVETRRTPNPCNTR